MVNRVYTEKIKSQLPLSKNMHFDFSEMGIKQEDKMSLLNCGHCTYWNKLEGAGGNTGECKRFPPQVTDDPGPPRFPWCDGEMFCAEFAQNDDYKEDFTTGQCYKILQEAAVEALKEFYQGEKMAHSTAKKLKHALKIVYAWDSSWE